MLCNCMGVFYVRHRGICTIRVSQIVHSNGINHQNVVRFSYANFGVGEVHCERYTSHRKKKGNGKSVENMVDLRFPENTAREQGCIAWHGPSTSGPNFRDLPHKLNCLDKNVVTGSMVNLSCNWISLYCISVNRSIPRNKSSGQILSGWSRKKTRLISTNDALEQLTGTNQSGQNSRLGAHFHWTLLRLIVLNPINALSCLSRQNIASHLER